MKRFLAACLACLLLLAPIANLTTARASEIQPRWDYTHSITVGLDISTWGIATCSGQFTAYGNVPVEIMMHLKQLKNGSWGTLKTWDVTGTASLTVEKQYVVEKGYTYKLVVTGYVYDTAGNLKETVSVSKTAIY